MIRHLCIKNCSGLGQEHLKRKHVYHGKLNLYKRGIFPTTF